MKIIECSRDAMQGMNTFIPTVKKITYINQLLQVGFDTIDFGSFVSPKAIPQMRDTAEVLASLDLTTSKSKLLAIVANTRGAEQTTKFKEINYLGFPLSISETFQQRNTNKSIAEALNDVDEIQQLCTAHKKELICYISMGFGNPYADPYDINLVAGFVDILVSLGIKIISLADTIGAAEPSHITFLFISLKKQFPDIEFGAHLHSTPDTALAKISAAYHAGCRRFDGAIKGYGGCPMAKDDLTGNLATETIVAFLESEGETTGIDKSAFAQSILLSDSVFVVH